jgi:hypothetical protein
VGPVIADGLPGSLRSPRRAGFVVTLRHSVPLPLQGEFYEALCKSIDPVAKELVCCFPDDAGMDSACFKLSYDVMVMAVSWPGK